MTAAVLDLPAYLDRSDVESLSDIELATRLADANHAWRTAHTEGRRTDVVEAKMSVRAFECETRRRAV